MTKSSIGTLLAVLTLAASFGSTAHAGKKASVTVVNDSDWAIHEFYVSSGEDDEWGPDQLKDQVIKSGGSFQLVDIPCDTYDVRLVDEDGDECVVEDVDICGTKETWEITSKDLARCQAATEE